MIVLDEKFAHLSGFKMKYAEFNAINTRSYLAY